MREIKYRGKCVNTGKWVYGDLRQIEKRAYILDYDICDNGVDEQLRLCDIAYEVGPETVGEYIPKMDFYEGDVLLGHEIGIVKYDENTGRIRIIDDSRDWCETEEFSFDSVLGNVHDDYFYWAYVIENGREKERKGENDCD